jgi:hypothetical protein
MQDEREYRDFTSLPGTTAGIRENMRENEHLLPGRVQGELFIRESTTHPQGGGKETEVRKARYGLRLPNGRSSFPAGVETVSTPVKKSVEKNGF